MNRKLKALGILIMSSALLLTACGSSDVATANGRGGLTSSEVVGEISNDAVKPSSITMMVD